MAIIHILTISISGEKMTFGAFRDEQKARDAAMDFFKNDGGLNVDEVVEVDSLSDIDVALSEEVFCVENVELS